MQPAVIKSVPRDLPPHREHSWTAAVLMTMAVYGTIIGLGFLKWSEPFEIKTLTVAGTPDQLTEGQDSRVEVDLQAAPQIAPTPAVATPIVPPEPVAPPQIPPPPHPPQLPPEPISIPIPIPAPIEPPVPVSTPPPQPVPAPEPALQKVPQASAPTKPPVRIASQPGASLPAKQTAPASGAATGASGGSGGVALGTTDFPNPPYPSAAVERRFQGTVVINLSVVDGNIQDIGIASSSGYVLLDSHTVRWIKSRWHFPKQLTRTFNQKITFKLDN